MTITRRIDRRGRIWHQDEEVTHFDNIASGLQVSPSFVEQYVGEVQQSFLRETAAMQRDARLATERHLAVCRRLLTAPGRG